MTGESKRKMSGSSRDTLFAEPVDTFQDFVFDDAVVKVFPDMINRSVPGYSTIVHMIGQITERYFQNGTYCYDLGCSLGAATLAMRHRLSGRDGKIIAIDSSKDMIQQCRHIIDADVSPVPVDTKQDDILTTDIHNASICVLNFTLQFIPLKHRIALLKKIYEGLVPGGILIVSEKLSFENEEHQALMTELHHYFKKTNGYSTMEIAQKRDAIENVLMPESFECHKKRLRKIGFSATELWFQCFNFASFIAFK